MGQIITKSDGNGVNDVIASVALTAAGFMGIFGTGNFQVFYDGTSNFVVPPNISRLRVRVIGAGAGYAHAIYAVTPSTSYVVTVASVGSNTT